MVEGVGVMGGWEGFGRLVVEWLDDVWLGEDRSLWRGWVEWWVVWKVMG